MCLMHSHGHLSRCTSRRLSPAARGSSSSYLEREALAALIDIIRASRGPYSRDAARDEGQDHHHGGPRTLQPGRSP